MRTRRWRRAPIGAAASVALAAALATALPAQHEPAGQSAAPTTGAAKAQPADTNTAAGAPTHAPQPRLAPLVAWQFVKQGNEAFANRRAAEARARAAAARGHDPVAAAGHVPAPGHHDDHGHTAADGHGHGERQPLRPAGAGRYVCAVLACADTDVDLAAAFGLQRRDLLVLRAPGPFVTAEAVALLERAVERHRLSLVVVLAHGDCDALRAPIGHQDALTRRIAALRSRARTPDERLTETLVTRQRQLLLASSRALSGRVEKDELRVVPGLFDDRTGRIEWVARRAHTLPIAPIK